MNKIKLIVGLGNPGLSYAKTRHNVGFSLLDALASREDLSFSKNAAFYGEISRYFFKEGESCWLLKPTTFMNLSGKSLLALSSFYKITPHEILVLLDDVSLPLGKIRIKPKGGSGGQKGLKSILESLKTEDIPRLRIGIRGEEGGPTLLSDYVLAPFLKSEELVLQEVFSFSLEAIDLILNHGLEEGMNRFNRNS